MLLVSNIRENLESYKEGLHKRGITEAEDLLLEIIDKDNQRKKTQQNLDELLANSNQLAKQIGRLMKDGQLAEAEAIKAQTSELKSKSKQLGEKLQEDEAELIKLLYNIPNIPNSIVPAGKNEEDNEIIKTAGIMPELPSYAVPHWDLIAKYDLIDFELGNKVAGAGFPFYKKEGARLVRALINYFLDQAIEKGFQEVQPPIIVNEASGYGTGQLPDKEGQMYHIEDTGLYMIPTAEVPITNMYRDVILDEKDLPVRHVGYTPCFRREAGSWGAHVRGLNRLHQFDKVEIVQLSTPEASEAALEQMIIHVESLVASLGLPYRILKLCAGDLGFTSSLTYDFEVYSAAQQKWLEVSSVSNFEAFQSNRLKLRYKTADGKKQLAHTLNGSALAVPRILAALLENNQLENEILIPEVLVPYTGFKSIRL
ncbi:MAG: seryl-tRNA synthetase [Cyclobacteriaceae bacterium]|jgi:seryl-tRNA synthetase